MRIKTNISKLLVPFLVIVLLGTFAIYKVWASSSIVPTTTISNTAPSFTAGPSDGGSDSTALTNVGTNVTFSATASDSNSDQYYLAICKTAAITAGSSAPPTCTGGNWCISAATNSGSGATCTYTVLQSDAANSAWNAYVCDGNGSPGACSAVSTGSGVTGSPWYANHRPVIGTVYAGASAGSNASIDPGNTAYFQVAVTDSDAGQTIDMYVCDNNTTSFNVSTGACTGGTTICSATGVSTGNNASCNNPTLVPVPTAHSASMPVKIYLRDNNTTKLGDDGSSTAHSYAVTDVTPAISSIVVTPSAVTFSGNDSQNVQATATLTDNNGYTDITLPTLSVYLSGTGSINASTARCTATSEANCYDATSGCSVSGQSGATENLTCGGAGSLALWYDALPSASWKAHFGSTSDLGVTSYASEGSLTVNSIVYLNISEANVNYGTLATGATSAAQSTTIQNEGNAVLDAEIGGTDMTYSSYSIPKAQQHWYTSSSWTWGTGDYALVASPTSGTAYNGCTDRNIAVTTAHGTPTSSALYWKIQIPASQQTGTYNGVINFTPETSATCTGGA